MIPSHEFKIYRNAIVVFGGVFLAFRVPRKTSTLKYHLYIGRRVHHYESGLYLAAAGLALFTEDIKDLFNGRQSNRIKPPIQESRRYMDGRRQYGLYREGLAFTERGG